MWTNSQFYMDLFTFTKEILKAKLHCSAVWNNIENSIMEGALTNLNLLTKNVSHHIETSQLICSVNQLTGFYIMENTGR